MPGLGLQRKELPLAQGPPHRQSRMYKGGFTAVVWLVRHLHLLPTAVEGRAQYDDLTDNGQWPCLWWLTALEGKVTGCAFPGCTPVAGVLVWGPLWPCST